jgi:quinol monooxygenase YgiN
VARCPRVGCLVIRSEVLGMFALVVRFDLVPGTGPAFDALVYETLGLIRAREPRTAIYACHQVEGAPDSRFFYELYEDRAAFDEHESGEHVKRFLAERERYLASPPRVEFLELSARFQPAVIGVAGVPRG